MSTPGLYLDGFDPIGGEAQFCLYQETLLHGTASTMASVKVNGEAMLLTIQDLRLLSTVADHLADALEFGGE